MSVLDNAIQTLFKLGIEVKKAWVNASPTSTFAAQKITVGKISDADMVAIEARNLAIGAAKDFFIVSRNSEESSPATSLNFATSSDNTVVSIYRQANVDFAAKQVLFSAGHNASPTKSSQNNNACIPYAIWVIKFLGGGYRIARFIKSLFFRMERGWA